LWFDKKNNILEKDNCDSTSIFYV